MRAVALAGLAGLALAGGAPAQPPSPPPAGAAPGPAAQAQRFIAPSGQLFMAPPGAPHPVMLWFAGADADGDGRLTQAEFLADAQRYFASLDTDRDGELDGFEVAAYEREVLRPLRAPATGPGTGPAGGPRPRGTPDVPRGQMITAGFWGLVDAPQPVKAADADMNARVTAAEYQKLLLARFATIDAAGAGVLTLATLPETPAQKAARAAAEAAARH
jgi:hypothetical protein